MEVQNLLQPGQIWSESHQLAQVQDRTAEQDSEEEKKRKSSTDTVSGPAKNLESETS